jgi:nucleoside phosphorylase
LIVTILDSEFEAARRHLPCLTPQTYRDDPLTYLRGSLAFGHEGESYSVVLIQLLETGTPGSAVAITNALRRVAPQVTIVAGIAGGVPGELRQGDVAVSRDLVYYEYGKQRDEGLEHRAPLV